MLIPVQILNQNRLSSGGVPTKEEGLLDPLSIEAVLPTEVRGYAYGEVVTVRTKSGGILLLACTVDKLRTDAALMEQLFSE